MKPRDKAEELVNKFRIVLMNEDTDCGNEVLCTLIAQKQALIAVDEVIQSYKDSWLQYWKEVKQEIEKL